MEENKNNISNLSDSEAGQRSRKHQKKDEIVMTSSPLSTKSQIEISSDDDDLAEKVENESDG